jgi:hypothetical protein
VEAVQLLASPKGAFTATSAELTPLVDHLMQLFQKQGASLSRIHFAPAVLRPLGKLGGRCMKLLLTVASSTSRM